MKEKTSAIVLAAGRGRRMNSDVQKQYMLLGNKPVLYYSLKILEESFIDEIILVTGQGEEEYCRIQIVDKYGLSKVTRILAGGKERYHSVANGVMAADPESRYLFIHDGARPFLSRDILDRTLEGVRSYGACVAAMPVKDTIKIADENALVVDTPCRNRLWLIQTPQVFTASVIRQAYKQLTARETEILDKGILITDDAMVVEYLTQHRVKLIEGSYENIKITTPEDLLLAEVYLNR